MYRRLPLIFFLLIFLALASEPFVFAQIDYPGSTLRAVLNIIILSLLFFEKPKFKFSELIIYSILALIILFELVVQRSTINNILSNYVVLLISFSLFRILKEDKFKFKLFFKMWLLFSFALAVGAIISFLVHQLSTLDADILNLESMDLFNPKYGYRESIFGFTIEKNFDFIKVVRVCSFFKEPQYAGLFFAVNMLLAINCGKLIPRKYLFVNLLAGFLTFSYTFYVVFLVALFFLIKQYMVRYILLIMFLFIIFLIFQIDALENIFEDFVTSSSYVDRLRRITNGIQVVVENLSITNFLFGNGINTFGEFNKDVLGRTISSGFLYLIYESGFFISYFILSLTTLIANKDRKLLLICIIYLLVFPWYKYYITWYLIIFCGLSYNKIAIKK